VKNKLHHEVLKSLSMWEIQHLFFRWEMLRVESEIKDDKAVAMVAPQLLAPENKQWNTELKLELGIS
jgi:hypothetical protein